MKTTLSLLCILGSLLWLQGCNTPTPGAASAPPAASEAKNTLQASDEEMQAADKGAAEVAKAPMAPGGAAARDESMALSHIQQNESEQRRRMMKQMAPSYDSGKDYEARQNAPMAAGSAPAGGRAVDVNGVPELSLTLLRLPATCLPRHRPRPLPHVR
jgi:hypothetical protein